MELLGAIKIWDNAEHNAFTDLVKFNGDLFCAFREASEHVSPDGALRVLKSQDDGDSWRPCALITHQDGDLRDARLLVFRGKLYLFGALAVKDKPLRSLMWRSQDGQLWSDAEECADLGYWLWRVIEIGNIVYGVAYCAGPHGDVRLYSATPNSATLYGHDFAALLTPLNAEGYVNESGLCFDNGEFYCLLRRDPVWDERKNALLGKSVTPYTDWSWRELDCRIGGPVAFRWQGRLMAIVRLYNERVRTSLVEICEASGHVAEHFALPSGGDTSYAGIVLPDDAGDELRVSYYSSHEGKTAIYFARIRLS